MKSLIQKLVMALALLAPLSAADMEPRAFYNIIFGTSQTYANDDIFGLGMRMTFPATEDIYLGFTADATLINSGDNGYTSHLALSLDYALSDALYLSGDYGWAWGFNNTGYINGTNTYSDYAAARGNYNTVGLHYQFSEYVDVGVMYRTTNFVILSTEANLLEEEILYTLNFAITPQTWVFFDTLFGGGGRR